MTTVQLGERLGLSKQAVAYLEERELEGRATIASLQRAADAMNCDLVYAVVPRSSLQQAVNEQARRKAVEEVGRIAHSMRLEDQGVSSKEMERQIEDRATELLLGSWKELWKLERNRLTHHRESPRDIK